MQGSQRKHTERKRPAPATHNLWFGVFKQVQIFVQLIFVASPYLKIPSLDKRGRGCRGLGQDRDMWRSHCGRSHHGRDSCQQGRVSPPELLAAPVLSTQTHSPAPMGSLFARFPLIDSSRGRRKGKMSGIQIQWIANLSF